MYLALGDPLQKRNYYRAGWIRFRDEADMTTVMTELTDKKVAICILLHVFLLTSRVRSKASSFTLLTLLSPL
jgi:hypothetical protein